MGEQEIERILSKLGEVKNKVDLIYQALYGVPGTSDKGMCGEFYDLKEDYYKFKQKAMITFFFLVGSGVLGTGIWQLVSYLK